MNMKAFSELTGLSAHTLRYYEKIGLLKSVQRNSSGHRVYTTRDVEWVSFIVRLKGTGMSIESMLEYAEYREQGRSTASKRQALLEKHRDRVKQHIALQEEYLAALEHKIHLYRTNAI